MKLRMLMIVIYFVGLPYAIALDGSSNDAQSIFNQAALKCPALEKYKSDYQSVLASSNAGVFYDGSYQTSLKSLKIKVNESTDVIPDEFKASGHTCEYTFTKDEDRLIIMKDPCISICEGRLIENNGSNYEKK